MTHRFGGFRAALLDFDMTLVNMYDSIDIFAMRRDLTASLKMNGFSVDGMRDLPVGMLRNAYMNDTGGEATRRERWKRASAVVSAYEVGAAEATVLSRDGRAFLDELASAELKVGIVSSNCEDSIMRCLSRLGISGSISVVVGRDTVLWDMKPSPAGAIIALEKMRVLPSETFGVGDSAVDMTAFRRAGVLPLGITGGVSSRSQLIEAGAVSVVRRLSEVSGALLQATR